MRRSHHNRRVSVVPSVIPERPTAPIVGEVDVVEKLNVCGMVQRDNDFVTGPPQPSQ